MKMSRGINLHFHSGKYSNAAESYATHTIRNILTEAAEFLCQNCQFERALCPAGTNFSSGTILSRRLRIIRGLYLSKEPLDYQKSSTRFRFSFQQPDEEIYTNSEPKLLRKKLIFPVSMTTGLCNLQARPVMQTQHSLFHVQEGNSDVTRSWNSATRQYRQVNATQGKRENNLHFAFTQKVITTFGRDCQEND